MDNRRIDKEFISAMLYGEEAYISEFSNAAIESFEEFLNDYSKYLMDRDMDNLRSAGHKIKPVAQMLHVEDLVEEYEHAKTLLNEEKPDSDLLQSKEKIEVICSQVIRDFRSILLSSD